MRCHDLPSSALCAIEQANRLACSPFVFQAAYCLREFGIFDFLDRAKEPVSLELLQKSVPQKLSLYALRVLTELGVAFNLLSVKDDKYSITKESRFLINDPMTRINFDFAHDVCYAGLDELKNALIDGKPDGLKTLYAGVKTIYPVISKLPEPAKTSWFKFNHFYSDVSYDASLPVLFADHPAHICDIGEQPFEIGNACLAAFSLYFTALAHGTSKFYSLADFKRFAEQAHLVIESVHHGLGTGHSLLVLKRAE